MGIRFDRDSRRATNGPLIFFNDPTSEIGLAQEIRGSINSGLSFYCYRQPGDLMISFGSSEGYLEGIGEPGYAIGFFEPDKPYLTIPYRGCKRTGEHKMFYDFPNHSTYFEEYKKEIEGIKEALSAGTTDKVVASRVILETAALDLSATFFELSRQYPDAYVFSFGTPATGCWIGASPEILLKSEHGTLSTMALAGTREASTISDWDPKNIEEQEIVTRYIYNVFNRCGLKPILEATFTKRAGNIEHICTPIHAEIPENPDIESLLRQLSPTPALCGSPKEQAIRIIKEYENFDRGCYGGFSGPYHSVSDFSMHVVLRCASVMEMAFAVYSGGGIVGSSCVETEWEETTLKADTFLSCVREEDTKIGTLLEDPDEYY